MFSDHGKIATAKWVMKFKVIESLKTILTYLQNKSIFNFFMGPLTLRRAFKFNACFCVDECISCFNLLYKMSFKIIVWSKWNVIYQTYRKYKKTAEVKCVFLFVCLNNSYGNERRGLKSWNDNMYEINFLMEMFRVWKS